MVENSIEEDIKCVQDFLEYSQDMINDMDYERPVDVTIYQQQINSMQHILSDYKRVLKENEELKNKLSLKQFDINVVYNDYLEKLNEYKENSIPKQKVKEKIEELDKKVKDYQCIENRINLYQRKVLQELLKESEE